MSDKQDKVVKYIKKHGMARPRDLHSLGIHPEDLRRLCRKGLLVRVSRGLYELPDSEPDPNQSLIEVCKQIPKGVICLLSALRFHGLTTQAPFEVWMAIDRKAWRPKRDGVAIRVVRFSKKAFSAGVEEHSIEGVRVNIYSPARTVADCFKYRNKIGLDVALEALRECWAERRCSMDELWKYARICRVANVMRPYLESLV